jgi:hypothetical protein
MRIRFDDEFRTVMEAVLIVFVVLKLTNVIAWPWIYVLMPFWIPFAFGVISIIWLKFMVNYFKENKK